MSNRVDLSEVMHSPGDGHMIADSFEMSLCETCDGAHFNMLAPSGEVFATATIGPEHFMALAAKFCEFNEHIRKRHAAPDGRQ